MSASNAGDPEGPSVHLPADQYERRDWRSTFAVAEIAQGVDSQRAPLEIGRGIFTHDWIEESGGAEKVLDQLLDTVPDTPVICLWSDVSSKEHGTRYRGSDLTQSPLARTWLRRHKKYALPFMPLVWRKQKVSAETSWILASTHLFAHHIAAPTGVTKLLYVHTPARYLWNPELDGRGAGTLKRIVAVPFKFIDRRRASEADHIATNSEFVAARIREKWGRDAKVIYPPVEVARISKNRSRWRNSLSAQDSSLYSALPAQFLFGASRLVAYKRLDQVIRAAAKMNTAVVIAGTGPEEDSYRELARKLGVEAFFLGRVSDPLLFTLYQECIAFVFPPIEDFGIMPVEAMASGGRVVVNRIGGAAETVQDGISGAHCDMSSVADIVEAIGRVQGCDSEAIVDRATEFDSSQFRSSVRSWLSGTTTLEKDWEKNGRGT